MSTVAVPEYRVLSLFSGCGGMDHGFHQAGFNISLAIDNDKDAVECYNANAKPVAVKAVIHANLNFIEYPDIIIAGPPCQGFSTGGGYKENDARNDMLAITCQIISARRPKIAVIENVESLTNSRNKVYFHGALDTLSSAGYFCQWQVLSADDYGVPQRRRRTVIVARRGGPFSIDIGRASQRMTLSSALAGISESDFNHHPVFPSEGTKHALIARHIGQGQKLCNVRSGPKSVATWDVPEVFGQVSREERNLLETIRKLRRTERKRKFGDADAVSIERISNETGFFDRTLIVRLMRAGYIRMIGEDFDLTNTFNGKYRRLEEDGYSPTVDTRFGDIQLFVHPNRDRALTVREAARIQGFSDSVRFPDNAKAAFRLIGNAVPPPMSRAVAEFCKGIL